MELSKQCKSRIEFAQAIERGPQTKKNVKFDLQIEKKKRCNKQ